MYQKLIIFLICCWLGLFLGCNQKFRHSAVKMRPSLFSTEDPLLQKPDYAAVKARFDWLHHHYFTKKHHQFHHRNSLNPNRFEGSYGLGPWDFYGDDIWVPGNREEMNATTYPLPGVAADVALAYFYAYKATGTEAYLQAALRILDNFLKHEQVKALFPEQVEGEAMSIRGSFSDWQIRTVFPRNYVFPDQYAYVDNPDPQANTFEILRKFSVPPLMSSDADTALDFTGYQAELKLGSVVPYSGNVFTYVGSQKNGPHPDAAARAVQAYSEAILLECPNSDAYLKIISQAAQGLYGFDLQNRWDTPATEVGSRVSGLVATVRSLHKLDKSRLLSSPSWPVEELLRDARLRVQMAADPRYPGWFWGWTPGGPIPDRIDWWIIQSGPDFFGTDILDADRFPWFLLIHDNYDTNEDNQLWYFSRVLLGIADFYPMIESSGETQPLRNALREFLIQGFNYFYHFQDTSQFVGLRGGINPDAYSVQEFCVNFKNYTQVDEGFGEVIKRFSHCSFGDEALSYPFPIGLQAAMTASQNIPELKKPLQPLIYSGMNHLLACSVFKKESLEHKEMLPLRNWLAPEVFKALGMYLKFAGE
jgi:hypothetical protein